MPKCQSIRFSTPLNVFTTDIASLEKGETDMQLSTFIMISEAVGLKLALTRQ